MRSGLFILFLAAGVLMGCGAGTATFVNSSTPAPTRSEPALPGGSQPGEPYPAPATQEQGYPATAVEAEPPGGYPEPTVPAPSREINPASLATAQPTLTPPSLIPDVVAGTPGGQLGKVVEAVARDLNAVTDVPLDEIRLVSIETAVWPNGGLGCPAEGVAYVEMLVEGMRITLEGGGRSYTYHTGGLDTFVLCEGGRPQSVGVIP